MSAIVNSIRVCDQELFFGTTYPESVFMHEGEFQLKNPVVDHHIINGDEKSAKEFAMKILPFRIGEMLLVRRSFCDKSTRERQYAVVEFCDFKLRRVTQPVEHPDFPLAHTQWDYDAEVYQIDYFGVKMAPSDSKISRKDFYECFVEARLQGLWPPKLSEDVLQLCE